MPTRRGMEMRGMKPEEMDQAQAKYVCYVCGEPVRGLAQRDEPNRKAARRGVTLGHRHRTCDPSEDAETSKKVMLAW